MILSGWVISTWTKQTSLFLYAYTWECVWTCVGIFCSFIFECCLEWITGKPAMVKAGGVGEKGRALCSCCLDPAWHEKGSLLPAPQISEMRGFWKGSQQAPLRWIKWDSSLQSKSLKKGGVMISNSLLKSLSSRCQNNRFETSNCLGSNVHFK